MAELIGGTTIAGYTALHSGLPWAYLSGDLTIGGGIRDSLLIKPSGSSDKKGLEIKATSDASGNAAVRLHMREGGDDLYGFSLGYNGGVANAVLNWAADSFNIARHDNNATGSVALSIPRTGGVLIYESMYMQTGAIIGHNSTDSYDKIRVWNASNYSIGMKSGLSFGYISNEYAMTFTMSNTANRGFLWRDDADAANDGAMSLTTDGRLYVKGIADVGSVNARGGVVSKGEGSLLDLDSTTHGYISFYPTGKANGRKGYLGFGGSGAVDFTIRNENTGHVVIGSTVANKGLVADTAFVLPVGADKWAT